MEKSLNLDFERFALPGKPAGQYAPLTLAYIGDAVYELVVRTVVTARHDVSVNRLNKRCADLVKAVTQSKMAETLKPYFTEKEAEIYRRGRNAHSPTTPKNAPVTDYRRATGFEAVMGYLYLNGETDRMMELVEIALLEEGEGSGEGT